MAVIDELCAQLAPIAADGIFQDDAPDDFALTDACIVVSYIDGTGSSHPINSGTRAITERYQIDFYGISSARVEALQSAVFTILDNYSGGLIQRCAWDSNGPRTRDRTTTPQQYHWSSDYIVESLV